VTLAFLQQELEAVNGVRVPGVAAFLLDRAGHRAAAGEPRAPEALLVREEGGELSLGLWLDEEVRRTVGQADPDRRRPLLTSRALLGALACAAEGVSHFVYLCTRAAADRPVSLLELEVQAEVDKFALLLLHLWRRGLRRLSPSLRRRLFERVRYRAHLGPEELSRYREANRLAAGYARWLEVRFVRNGDADGLLRELRRTYRRGGREKLGYLGARAQP